MQKTKDDMICNEDFFNFEDFLLVHESSQQAFMNLSKIKTALSKDELLDETKRLLQEHIMKQITVDQVSPKKQGIYKTGKRK